MSITLKVPLGSRRRTYENQMNQMVTVVQGCSGCLLLVVAIIVGWVLLQVLPMPIQANIDFTQFMP